MILLLQGLLQGQLGPSSSVSEKHTERLINLGGLVISVRERSFWEFGREGNGTWMMGQRRKEGSEMLKEQSEKQAGPGCVGYILSSGSWQKYYRVELLSSSEIDTKRIGGNSSKFYIDTEQQQNVFNSSVSPLAFLCKAQGWGPWLSAIGWA